MILKKLKRHLELVSLSPVLQTTWENAISPYGNRTLACPLAKSLCETEVSFQLHTG